MEDINPCHKVNLTMLHKNVWSKKDKRQEQNDRFDDHNITASPDSIKYTLIDDDEFIVDKVHIYTLCSFINSLLQ